MSMRHSQAFYRLKILHRVTMAIIPVALAIKVALFHTAQFYRWPVRTQRSFFHNIIILIFRT